MHSARANDPARVTRRAMAALAAAAVVCAIAWAAPRQAVAGQAPQAASAPFFGWGNNFAGQIGDGSTDNQFTPEAVTLPAGVDPVAVAEGARFSLALGSDQLIYSWGDNSDGQLGDGTNNGRLSPAAISLPGGMTVAGISAGYDFGMALGTDGLVYWWGTDPETALGGPAGQQLVPEQIPLPGGDTAQSVAAFGDVATAIGTDGKLFAWGDNTGGELGDGTQTNQDTPEHIAIPGNDPIAEVSIGPGFGLAVGTDGKLFSWGEYFGDGQLGNGGTGPQPTPAQISLPGGVAARAVATEETGGLAVGVDGKVYTWGYNLSGVLGDGASETEVQQTPKAITLPYGALASSVASTGYLTSYAVGLNGALYAWGYNSDGEVGDGTLNDSRVPKLVHIPGGAVVGAISADNVALAVSPTGPPAPFAPEIVQASPPSWTASGAQFSYKVVAAGSPAPTYALASGAPGWLAIDPATGTVSGLVPADISSFSFAVTATNNLGSVTTPALTVNAGPVVSVGGHVVDVNLSPVPGALVQLCASTGCTATQTDSNGAYQLSAIAGDTVTLTGYPPAAGTSNMGTRTVGPLAVPSGGTATQDIGLTGYVPLPSGTSIPSLGGATPTTLQWTQPVPITVQGCPGGVGIATIIGPDSTTGQLSARVATLTETPQGSGNYAGTIGAMYPIDGPAQVTPSVICPPGGPITPAAGPQAGGTSVFLSGSGFTGATAVAFGGVPATSFSVVDDSTIKAQAPAGHGAVSVTVTTADGSQQVVGPYSYQAITSVSPGSGPPAGGTTVTITGSGLALATQVLFGSAPAGFTQVSDTKITAVSPAGTGTADVTVVTPYGTTPVAPADQFTYTSAAAARTTAAVARTTAARVPKSALARRPAVSPELILEVKEVVEQTVSGLLTEEDTTKLLVAARNALQNANCETSKAYLTNLIKFALAPLSDVIVEDVLFAALAAEASAVFLAPYWLVLMPVTAFLVNMLVSALVDKLIDAEADAFLGTCGAPEQPNILIDPSGTVVDTAGNPIGGATVTLLRSDTLGGSYAPVDPAGPGIEPPVNPQTTAADGTFHWDVLAGYYEVQAAAPDCADASDPSQAAATIGPYPVPPPQVGLVITMACAGQSTPAVPTVQGLSQNSGTPAGGDTITVSGTGFTPSASVDFGSTPSPLVTYLSAQELSVVTPPGAGSADVTVSTGGGTSAASAADQFFFGSAPAVTSLSVKRGPVTGGGTITITGTGFSGANAVSFGPVPATSVTVVSDTKITATIPPNLAGAVDVTVANPAGTSAAKAADRYTYAAVPLAIDAEKSATGPVTTTATVTTKAANDLLVAFVAAGGPANARQQAKVSGSGLKWTLATRENSQRGDAEIWVARVAKAGSYRVTSKLARGGYQQQLTLVAFAGAAGRGNVAIASAKTGAPAGRLTTSGAGSWVFGVGDDGDHAVDRVAGAGQKIIAEALGKPAGTFWVQAPLKPAVAAGRSVRIYDTAPTRDHWNLALIEIVATGS